MKNDLYNQVYKFLNKYPQTIAWRIKKNCSVIEMHLNPGEKVKYAFAAQKSQSVFNIVSTCIVAITNERLLVGYKRVVFGYNLYSITPDLYNDLTVKCGIIWGNIIIDTVKEVIELSNIQKKALPEIETAITKFMMDEKKKYKKREKESR